MSNFQKLILGLEWFKNPDHTPFFIALEFGWFREVNLDVELVEPGAHMDAIDAINDGNHAQSRRRAFFLKLLHVKSIFAT